MRELVLRVAEVFGETARNDARAITAIIAIALIEGAAIMQGIDGVALSLALAAISGLGGYGLAKKQYETGVKRK